MPAFVLSRWRVRLAGLALLLSCATKDSTPPSDSAAAASDTSRPVVAATPPWKVRRLETAPSRFRPGGWWSEDELWGVVGGRLTRFDTRTGAVRMMAHEAWSIHGGAGVIGWRNGAGAWIVTEGQNPTLVGSTEGSDGPSTLLWSPDGSRLLLGWAGEWDASYDLIARDGAKRRLEVSLPGYFGNDAALWLDSSRVLFHTVAKGPVGGAPEYRESGWRGDLAVLDLRTGAYTRVTTVPDTITLRVAGLHPDGVLVTERGPEGVRRHWIYDTTRWQRSAIALPKGRAFSSAGGAMVVLLDATTDSTTAVLVSGGATTELGRVQLDAEPAFTPSGRRGALRTSRGVMIFEPQ